MGVQKAPCEGSTAWDLDAQTANLTTILRAVQTCATCPLRAACAEARESLPQRPAGVIWAGVAYSDTGQVLDGAGLRRLAARARHQRERQAAASVVAA